jgi:hypothetical protein
MASTPVQPSSETAPADTVEQRFRRLAAAWSEVAPSHPRQPVHYHDPVYQEIIDLGPAVVPFLLRALAEYPRDWFWALHVITGADPITPEERGSCTGMRAAWLRWGSEQGYLPDDARGAGGSNETPDPAPRPVGEGGPTLEQKFQRLAAIWRVETGYLSSPTAMVNHPAYQEIIGLRPAAVSLVLRELEQRPAHWFDALHALTGADPMDPADRGKVRKIAEAWLRWGRANGYRC